MLRSYFLNPYLLLPSLALSTSSLDNTLTLLSIMFASQGSYFPLVIRATSERHTARSRFGVLALPGFPCTSLTVVNIASRAITSPPCWRPVVSFGITKTNRVESTQNDTTLGRIRNLLFDLDLRCDARFWRLDVDAENLGRNVSRNPSLVFLCSILNEGSA